MWNSLLKTSFTLIQIILLSACDQVPNAASLTGDSTTSNLASRNPSRSRNSDKCIDSSRCESTCNEIYLRANALSSCYNLGENQVNDIFEVFETLKSPRRRSSLDGINVSDMKAYLKVDHNSLLDLIDPIQKDERRGSKDKGDLFAYSEDSAEYVLEWIADNEDIAQIFRAEDRDHEIIKELLIVYGSAGDASRPRGDDSAGLIRISGEEEATDPFLLGFSYDGFDDVSLISYAKSKDNEILVSLLRDVVVANCSGLVVTCVEAYYYLAREKEGDEYYTNEFVRNLRSAGESSICVDSSTCRSTCEDEYSENGTLLYSCYNLKTVQVNKLIETLDAFESDAENTLQLLADNKDILEWIAANEIIEGFNGISGVIIYLLRVYGSAGEANRDLDHNAFYGVDNLDEDSALGFIHNGFGGMSLISYAHAQNNEFLVSLLHGAVEEDCGSSSECTNRYYCLARDQEGAGHYASDYIESEDDISCTEEV